MLIAKCPILYGGRQYEKGDALPGDSPLVSKWLENGVAFMENVNSEPAKPVEESPKPETPDLGAEKKAATTRKKK